jgi:hypothetical protein
MDSERADQHAAGKPHLPRTAADSRGAVFAPEMDDLGHVGRHRDRDSDNTEDLKHGFPLLVSSSRRLRGRQRRFHSFTLR